MNRWSSIRFVAGHPRLLTTCQEEMSEQEQKHETGMIVSVIRFFIRAAMTGACLVLTFMLVQSYLEARERRKELKNVQQIYKQKIKRLQFKRKHLSLKKAKLKRDPDVIKRELRNQLNLLGPDEIRVVE